VRERGYSHRVDPARISMLARSRAAAAAARAARARRRIDELENWHAADPDAAEEQSREAHERAREVHRDAADIHEESAAYLREHGDAAAAARAEKLADQNREAADREGAEAEAES
jgi:hypothetical protein